MKSLHTPTTIPYEQVRDKAAEMYARSKAAKRRKHRYAPAAKGDPEWTKRKPGHLHSVEDLGFGYTPEQRREIGLPKQKRVPGSADDSNRGPVTEYGTTGGGTKGRKRRVRKPGKRKPDSRRKWRTNMIRRRIEKEQADIAQEIEDRRVRKKIVGDRPYPITAKEKAELKAKEMARRAKVKADRDAKRSSSLKRWRKGVSRKTKGGTMRYRLKKRKLY